MLIAVKLMPTHHQWVQPQPNNMLKQNIDYFKPQGNVATAFMNRFFQISKPVDKSQSLLSNQIYDYQYLKSCNYDCIFKTHSYKGVIIKSTYNSAYLIHE